MIGYFIGIIFGCLTVFFTTRYYSHPKYIYYTSNDNGWLEIDKDPIPENIQNNNDIIISDGNEVKTVCFIYFNSKGEVLYSSYKKNLVTHWMPLPKPPSQKYPPAP